MTSLHRFSYQVDAVASLSDFVREIESLYLKGGGGTDKTNYSCRVESFFFLQKNTTFGALRDIGVFTSSAFFER